MDRGQSFDHTSTKELENAHPPPHPTSAKIPTCAPQNMWVNNESTRDAGPRNPRVIFAWPLVSISIATFLCSLSPSTFIQWLISMLYGRGEGRGEEFNSQLDAILVSAYRKLHTFLSMVLFFRPWVVPTCHYWQTRNEYLVISLQTGANSY